MTDKLPWLGLRSIPGVGIVLGQRLLQRFDNPAAIFKASFQDLMAVKGITPAFPTRGGCPERGKFGKNARLTAKFPLRGPD